MATIREMIRHANAEGFIGDNAEAKVCQDIVLMDLSMSATTHPFGILCKVEYNLPIVFHGTSFFVSSSTENFIISAVPHF